MQNCCSSSKRTITTCSLSDKREKQHSYFSNKWAMQHSQAKQVSNHAHYQTSEQYTTLFSTKEAGHATLLELFVDLTWRLRVATGRAWSVASKFKLRKTDEYGRFSRVELRGCDQSQLPIEHRSAMSNDVVFSLIPRSCSFLPFEPCNIQKEL